MRFFTTAQGIALLLPLVTHRAPGRPTMLSGYPEFDYENVGNIKKPVQVTAPPPPPPPPPYRPATSLVPASLEIALREFDFASSSDEEVAAIAARLMEQLKREACYAHPNPNPNPNPNLHPSPIVSVPGAGARAGLGLGSGLGLGLGLA